MIVRYYQPFQEVDYLKRQLDRLFGDFVESDQTTWSPAVALLEDGDEYVVQVQLPGIDTDTIDIQASRKAIVISGERKAPDYGEHQTVLHNEVRYGTFRRVIHLPATIEHEQVKADYREGVLTIHLPKTAEVRNRVVKVNVNGATPEITSEETTEA